MRQDLSTLDRDIGQPWSRVIQEAFRDGIDCDIIHGGLLVGGSQQGLYGQSATPNYIIGTRRISPDGRVYRYVKATNIIAQTHFGLKFYSRIADGIGNTPPLQTQIVGDSTIKIDSGKGAAGVAKDELVGGYVIIHLGSDNYNQFRGITGNTLADGDGYVTITLDAPLTAAIKLSHSVEVLQNPYGNVRLMAGPSGGMAGTGFASVAGIPNVKTLVANQYIWIQTWGPIWINPHGDAGSGVDQCERKLVFDAEGSVSVADEVSHGGITQTDGDEQVAGFIIDRVAGGPPLIMLQISP